MTQSLVEVVGCTVGSAIAGPAGAITGSIIGKLISLLPGLDDIISGVAGNLVTDTLKSYWSRPHTEDATQINHDLQTAFRDSVREGLYDIGGKLCFPKEWNAQGETPKQRRDVPDKVVYWETNHGRAVLHMDQSQVAEVCAILQWLDAQIEQQHLLPLEPPNEQHWENSQSYLLDPTSQALATEFFEKIIDPELKHFRQIVPSFYNHLRTHLFDRTLVHLGEALKQRTTVWRAFNRLILEELRHDLHHLGQDQQTIMKQLDQLIKVMITPEWSQDLATLMSSFGKIEKDQQDNFEAVFNRLTDIQEQLAAIAHPQAPIIPHTVPDPVLDFVGRQHEIDELVAELRAIRCGVKPAGIWWVYGMPGVGKTQFAYAVAQYVKDDFPDGQILLEMRGTRENPMQVDEALANVIHAFDEGKSLPTELADLQQQYTQVLQGKRVLIIADTVQDKTQIELLTPPPQGCALIVLSRQRAIVPGASLYELSTMQESEAEAWIASVVSKHYADSLAELCGYLPLALRISTTLLRQDPTIDIEEYLQQMNDERMRLSGLQEPHLADRPAHSVKASFNLSYKSLDQVMRQALCQLAVFVGTFEASAVAKVVVLPEGAGISSKQALSFLFQRSFLSYNQASKRYGLHDLIRIFSFEQLQESGSEAEPRIRHAEYYATQAEQAKNGLNHPDQAHWLRYLDAEYENLIVAMQWSQTHGRIEVAARIGGSLYGYWTMRSALHEGRTLLKQILDNFSVPLNEHMKQLQTKLLNSVGLLAFLQTDYASARKAFEANLKTCNNNELGYIVALANLALIAEQEGKYDEAFDWYLQSLAVFQALGDTSRTASTLHNIGVLKYIQKDYAQAEHFHQQSLALRRSANDTWGIARSLENLAWVALEKPEWSQAKEMLTEALGHSWELGDQEHIAYCLEGLCAVAQVSQQEAWAARLWGAAETLRSTIGAPVQDSDKERYTSMVAAIQAELGDEAFNAATQQGSSVPLAMIIQEVLQSPNMPLTP